MPSARRGDPATRRGVASRIKGMPRRRQGAAPTNVRPGSRVIHLAFARPGNLVRLLGVLALSADGVALYWALPTEGSPPEYTRVWSSMVGPRPMKTLKVAELSTGRFETVVSSIDPRRDLTFGPGR